MSSDGTLTLGDLTSLEDEVQQKLKSLQIMKDIRGGWGRDTVDEFADMSKELLAMKREVTSYKEAICQARSDLKGGLSLLTQIQQLTSVTGHMKENLPSHLPSVTQEQEKAKSKSDKENTTNTGKVKGQEKAQTKGNSGKSKQIPTLQYITTDEFDSVSKYIKGRLQYDQVNNAVDEVNKALETKYTLLMRPRAKLSEFDMKTVTACKLQENQETKGRHFVIDADIKRWSSLKLDNAGRSILTILRTLKRLREIRGPGNLIRYTVV